MIFLLGVATVFGSVLFGFVMSHGQLQALWQPFEILIIIGAAAGAYLISNPWHVIKAGLAMTPAVIFGSRSARQLPVDTLQLIHDLLTKARREGMMAIEDDVENPHASALFSRYPNVQNNQDLAAFIADYFRIIAVGNLSAYELEGLMDHEIEVRLHELESPARALGHVADALPGFGIVAAVLGIVITMGAIDGEVAAIGQHVAAALVGTFSGVLLAYGIVGPISTKMKHLAEEEIRLYEASRAAILASLNGLPPRLSVEFGRKALSCHNRPGFDQLDQTLRGR